MKNLSITLEDELLPLCGPRAPWPPKAICYQLIQENLASIKTEGEKP